MKVSRLQLRMLTLAILSSDYQLFTHHTQLTLTTGASQKIAAECNRGWQTICKYLGWKVVQSNFFLASTPTSSNSFAPYSAVLFPFWTCQELNGAIYLSYLYFYLQVYVVCPSTVQFERDNFFMVKQFFPHLTMEDVPNFSMLISKEVASGHCGSNTPEQRYLDPSQNLKQCSSLTNKDPWMNNVLSWFKSEMSLNLFQYRVE